MSRRLMPLVQVTILARDNAEYLPMFLKCIENIDYDKKSLSIYVHTNNNSDQTAKILKQWCMDKQAQNCYYNVKFIEQSFPQLKGKKGKHFTGNGGDEAWYADDGIRLKILSVIRDASLKHAVRTGADYYFVCDIDNFFPPETIRYCVEQDKPIFAPMMVENSGNPNPVMSHRTLHKSAEVTGLNA